MTTTDYINTFTVEFTEAEARRVLARTIDDRDKIDNCERDARDIDPDDADADYLAELNALNALAGSIIDKLATTMTASGTFTVEFTEAEARRTLALAVNDFEVHSRASDPTRWPLAELDRPIVDKLVAELSTVDGFDPADGRWDW